VGFSFYSKIDTTVRGALEMQRNFYGVFRVRSILVGEPPRKAFTLTHGITSHGLQFEDRALRAVPTSYYGRSSGIGLAIDSFRSSNGGSRPKTGLKVGVIGLGVGTLAAYGESGDIFRFYEINPDIIQLAQGEGGYFSYLGDTRAALEIVPGDARLSLEAELDRGERQGFDILAVDAFSGDSIPVHLLTAEALGIYLEHLQPQGLLAMHISNRYLDLTSVAREAANLHDLGLALIHGPRDNSGSYASSWALFSRDRAVLARPLIASKAGDLPELGAIRPWTDDYSNLFQVLNLNPSSFWSVPALSWP
jgi:hypothetical protein